MLLPIVIAVFAAFLIGGPIASAMRTHSPIVGIVIGVIAFFIASAVFGSRRGQSDE